MRKTCPSRARNRLRPCLDPAFITIPTPATLTHVQTAIPSLPLLDPHHTTPPPTPHNSSTQTTQPRTSIVRTQRARSAGIATSGLAPACDSPALCVFGLAVAGAAGDGKAVVGGKAKVAQGSTGAGLEEDGSPPELVCSTGAGVEEDESPATPQDSVDTGREGSGSPSTLESATDVSGSPPLLASSAPSTAMGCNGGDTLTGEGAREVDCPAGQAGVVVPVVAGVIVIADEVAAGAESASTAPSTIADKARGVTVSITVATGPGQCSCSPNR